MVDVEPGAYLEGDDCSHVLDACRESHVNSITALRPGISRLLDGENLDLVVAHQDNIAWGFAN